MVSNLTNKQNKQPPLTLKRPYINGLYNNVWYGIFYTFFLMETACYCIINESLNNDGQ